MLAGEELSSRKIGVIYTVLGKNPMRTKSHVGKNPMRKKSQKKKIFPRGIFPYMGFCPHGILSGYPFTHRYGLKFLKILK